MASPITDRQRRFTTTFAQLDLRTFKTYDGRELDDLYTKTIERADYPEDQHQYVAVASHKVGFAIMLGRLTSLTLFPLHCRCHVEAHCCCKQPTLIVYKLLEFADLYSSVKAMASGIERFILSEDVGKWEIRAFCFTYLRIARILESEDIYRIAMSKIADKELERREERHQYLWDAVAGDQQLLACILERTAALRDYEDSIASELLCIRVDVKHNPTRILATNIWRDWFHYRCTDSARREAMYFLALGNFNSALVIKEYCVRVLEAQTLPRGYEPSVVEDTMDKIFEVAHRAASALVDIQASDSRSHYAIPYRGLSFEDYQYPWQQEFRTNKEVSFLTSVYNKTIHKELDSHT